MCGFVLYPLLAHWPYISSFAGVDYEFFLFSNHYYQSLAGPSKMPTILVNIGFKRSRWPERPPKKIYPFEWDDFTIDACTCTANSKCDACDLGEAFATRDPRDIVADVYAYEAPSNGLFMNKLAALSLCDARYRRAGATEAFIWVFGRGRQGLEEDFWVYPLLGLVNILSGIHRDNTQQQDAHILRKIHGMCPKIISAIWAVDEGRAFDASRRNEHWRALLMKFVCLVLCDNEVRRSVGCIRFPSEDMDLLSPPNF